jgi:hypothetical protein
MSFDFRSPQQRKSCPPLARRFERCVRDFSPGQEIVPG